MGMSVVETCRKKEFFFCMIVAMFFSTGYSLHEEASMEVAFLKQKA